MLNDEQSRDYDRAKKLQKFFSENDNVYTPYKPFAKRVSLFNEHLADLNKLIPQKDASGKSATTSKEVLKKDIAATGNNICTIARSYAMDVDNASLAAAMNYKTTAIYRLKDGDVLAFVQNIFDTLSPLTPDPTFADYEITQPMLDDLLEEAKKFNSMIGTADVIDSGSSIANKNIDARFKLIDADIRQFDLLINYFVKKAPDFYAGYHINSAIDNIGIHHSGIEGLITSAATKQPIQNAHIALIGTKKSATTDLLGHYQLIRVDTNDYKAEFSADSFTTKTMIIHIERGRITKLNVEL